MRHRCAQTLRLIYQVLSPLEPKGGRWPGVTVLLLVAGALALGVATGFEGGVHYDRAYFAHRYPVRHELRVPAGQPRIVRSLPGVTVRTTGSVDIAEYPAVGDQGPYGACAGWASAWDVSYDFRMTHLATHPALKFSPCSPYNRYVQQYDGGQDLGSWPDQLVAYWAQGVPQFKYVPCPEPVNTPDSATALAHRWWLNLRVADWYVNQAGNSPVAWQDARAVIASGSPALVALNVTPEYDNATQTGGLIWDHGPQPSRGAHENVGIAFDDTKVFPNGDVGGLLLQNQWSRAWGAYGRAWVSYAWAARNIWAVEQVTGLLPAATAATAPARPASFQGPTYAPPRHVTGTPRPGSGYAWYVRHGLYTHDTHQDISWQLNSAGDRFHVWPLALAATVGTESNFVVRAEHWWAYPDWSCGLMQQIIPNVTQHTGITGARAACDWEENPTHSIAFGAQLYHQYAGICGEPWPYLYSCYNAGPYQSDWFYHHPTGYAFQAQQNFRGWLAVMLAAYQWRR